MSHSAGEFLRAWRVRRGDLISTSLPVGILFLLDGDALFEEAVGKDYQRWTPVRGPSLVSLKGTRPSLMGSATTLWKWSYQEQRFLWVKRLMKDDTVLLYKVEAMADSVSSVILILEDERFVEIRKDVHICVVT
jgi:hypothetical protein